MQNSFFFYDLETSGLDPRSSRIMQFAGQRTDMNLKPIGDPVNVFVKLTPDTLPSPDAILVTGITPQQTIAEGLTEAEFLKFFYEEVVQPGTIFVGFNSVRFDDEFMRYLHYRNFYDPYGWQWKDGCSRWDILDLIRMTRALRPDGINWPFAPDGKPANRLEMLTDVNKLDHSNAHDALSDVFATIAVAKLIQTKQPDLFKYLLQYRNKKSAKELVQKNEPFVYTTGRYPSEFLHTSAAVLLTSHSTQDAALVYDLHHDPRPFIKMSVSEIVQAWRYTKDPEALRLPVKTLKYNRCPAIAPLGVIKDSIVQERLGLTLEKIKKNLSYLNAAKQEFSAKVLEAAEVLDKERQAKQGELISNELTVDSRLYDGFLGDADSVLMSVARAAQPDELADYKAKFSDDRLKGLLPLYKARNYPKSLTSEERSTWDDFRAKKILSGGTSSEAAKYFNRIEELAKQTTDKNKQYLLEELRLYGESILPGDEVG